MWCSVISSDDSSNTVHNTTTVIFHGARSNKTAEIVDDTKLNRIMLSVQVPGCAGMERLSGGTRLRHDRHHSTLEWEKQQRLHAMVGRLQEMVEHESRARSAAAAERLRLPPAIQLPDGEFGPDAHLQLRVPYQQAELTRSFQAPPNKCVSDVPEWTETWAEAADARRGKKDGLLQRASRWWARSTRPHYLPPPRRDRADV